MTRRPDLGFALASVGLAVIVLAVVGGFLAVGGPGSARSERLDGATMQRVRDIARSVSCSVYSGKEAPTDLADLALNPPGTWQRSAGNTCTGFDPSAIRSPKDIEYTRIDASHIRLCADFLLPFDHTKPLPRGWYSDTDFPQLDADRPAGHYCYELKVGR